MSGKPSSRLTKRQQTAVIKHIQTSAIVKRLVKHVLAEQDVMTASQVNAAKILLNKTIPDLKALEHSGNIDSEVTYKSIVKRFDGSLDADS